MTKTIITALTAGLLSATAASAQDHAGMDHGGMVHDGAQHAHDHAGADVLPADAPIDPVAARTLIVRVDGMVCDFCARSLTKVLSRKDAVEDVAVSLKDKTVTILLAEGAAMTDAEVEEAVLSAGYSLASIGRS